LNDLFRIAYIAMFSVLTVMNIRVMVLRPMTPCSSPNGYQRSSETSVSTAFKNTTHFDPTGEVCVYSPLGLRGITNKMT